MGEILLHEPLPPVVPVPLSTLLGLPDLGLRQVAGPAADTLVHAVHTSEMADPVPYLLGGELLLSAGVAAPARDADAYWDRYAARTVEAGAAALGFGVAPVHTAVPPGLAAACERRGLRLVEVPEPTPFTAVARAMGRTAAALRHQGLHRLAEAQQALTAAAARPHPVPAVLSRLASHLGGWTALYAPDGTEALTAGTAPPPAVRASLARLAGRLRPGLSSAARTVDGLHLSAYGLGGSRPSGPARAALGLSVPRRDPADTAIAGVAVVLLSLLTADRPAADAAGRTAALVRLLLGEDAAGVAGLLGDGTGRWTVVHGRRRGRGTEEAAGPLAAGALAAGLGTELIGLDGDGLRALVPEGTEVRAQQGWTLGTAGPVDADRLVEGSADAARALRRALAERVPLVRHRADGGAGLASLVDEEEARALARSALAPLEDRPELVETVRTWLSVHGSWDRSATALGVHRNTVRQRVARAAALLDADLGDADVRMELWFLLKRV
ncbi:PucR family transcriptional regulator [Streptomyces sp. I05A-00742]|uniref:PucR family transcriptional regulator ligand-binding domain-containing protein n=1 Tax=Streptomyces sp. I05A-00742 TaxID=2732853 RepID=UPI001488AE03|nr:PucR family transcriptional regulator [Streptomyces sp. I05A-00742]